MIKLLATDIDHTLYDAGIGKISASNIMAIEKLKQHHIILVLVSGRVVHGMQDILQKLPMDKEHDFYVANNGAQVLYVKDNSYLFHQPFTQDDLVLLQKECLANELTFCVQEGSINYASEYNERIAYDFYAVGQDLFITHDVLSKIDFPVYHVSFTSNSASKANEVKEKLGLKYPQYSFNATMEGYIDVALNGVNKAAALKHICQILKITKDECACIGDGENDASMLQWAGLSACVANGSQLAKEAADYLVNSCQDNGFAQFVNEYVLKERKDES